MTGPTKTKPKAVTIKADDLKSGKLTVASNDELLAMLTSINTLLKLQANAAGRNLTVDESKIL